MVLGFNHQRQISKRHKNSKKWLNKVYKLLPLLGPVILTQPSMEPATMALSKGFWGFLKSVLLRNCRTASLKKNKKKKHEFYLYDLVFEQKLHKKKTMSINNSHQLHIKMYNIRSFKPLIYSFLSDTLGWHSTLGLDERCNLACISCLFMKINQKNWKKGGGGRMAQVAFPSGEATGMFLS